MRAPLPIHRTLLATVALVGAWVPAAMLATPRSVPVRLDPIVVSEAPAPLSPAIPPQVEA